MLRVVIALLPLLLLSTPLSAQIIDGYGEPTALISKEWMDKQELSAPSNLTIAQLDSAGTGVLKLDYKVNGKIVVIRQFQNAAKAYLMVSVDGETLVVPRNFGTDETFNPTVLSWDGINKVQQSFLMRDTRSEDHPFGRRIYERRMLPRDAMLLYALNGVKIGVRCYPYDHQEGNRTVHPWYVAMDGLELILERPDTHELKIRETVGYKLDEAFALEPNANYVDWAWRSSSPRATEIALKGTDIVLREYKSFDENGELHVAVEIKSGEYVLQIFHSDEGFPAKIFKVSDKYQPEPLFAGEIADLGSVVGPELNNKPFSAIFHDVEQVEPKSLSIIFEGTFYNLDYLNSADLSGRQYLYLFQLIAVPVEQPGQPNEATIPFPRLRLIFNSSSQPYESTFANMDVAR